METLREDRGGWHWLAALPVAVLAVVLVFCAARWGELEVYISPYSALQRAAERLEPLPAPMSLSLLGEAETEEGRWSFSGVIDCQEGEDGLMLYLRDATLGDETGSLTFSAYLDPHVAAMRAPDLSGGPDFYGVELDRPLLDQARGTGGDPDYGWYFDAARLEEAQRAADQAREALTALRLPQNWTGEWEALDRLLKTSSATVAETPSGFELTFRAEEAAASAFRTQLGIPREWGTGGAVLGFTLTEGVLTTVTVEGEGGSFQLDLSDALRVELTVPGLTLTTAVTVTPASPLTSPAYTPAFPLLPYVEGAVSPPPTTVQDGADAPSTTAQEGVDAPPAAGEPSTP